MRKQTAIWTTKSGHRVRICDMTDTHLLNTIKFLRRTADTHLSACISAAYSVGSSFNPDSMASFCCDQDIDRMENTSVDDFLDNETPLYAKLVDEAERRGLTHP